MPLLSRLIATALCLHTFQCVSVVDCTGEEQVPVLVNRRGVGNDIVTYITQVASPDNSSSVSQNVTINCDNHTYIVNEGKCVNNQDLLEGVYLDL